MKNLIVTVFLLIGAPSFACTFGVEGLGVSQPLAASGEWTLERMTYGEVLAFENGSLSCSIERVTRDDGIVMPAIRLSMLGVKTEMYAELLSIVEDLETDTSYMGQHNTHEGLPIYAYRTMTESRPETMNFEIYPPNVTVLTGSCTGPAEQALQIVKRILTPAANEVCPQ